MKPLNDSEIARLAEIDIFDKVDQGEWYQYAKEPAIQAIVKASAQRVQIINDVAKTDIEEATRLLHEFLPNLAETADVYFPITAIEHPERLTVGENSFINANLQILSAGKVTIGDNCFIGPNTQLYTPNHHPYDVALRREDGNTICQLQSEMMFGLVAQWLSYPVSRLVITLWLVLEASSRKIFQVTRWLRVIRHVPLKI